MQQLSYQMGQTKKSLELALEQLQRSKQVVKRSLVRNQVVYYLPLISMLSQTKEPEEPSRVRRMLDQVLNKLV